ncbi:MAG TPA: AAA family ATPase [Halothiobacillus sp.]|nr:AAA family ATPase [Halothiobacillus sp.]
MNKPMKKLNTEYQEWDAHCEKHGPYRVRGIVINGKRIGGICPKCEEERMQKQQQEEQARQKRERAAMLERLLGSAGIPPRFQGRTFANFRVERDNQGQASALRLCRAYAKRFHEMMAAGTCLIMVGSPGTGKTHLASAIAQSVIIDGRSVVHFTTAGRLLRHVKSTYGRDSAQTEEQAIRSYLAPDLLIVDEVGVQRGTDAERFILTEVLGLRYEYMKPVIVIGNCTEDELRSHLGDRLYSRLQEGGGSVIVFDWDDYRPKVHRDERLPWRRVPPA